MKLKMIRVVGFLCRIPDLHGKQYIKKDGGFTCKVKDAMRVPKEEVDQLLLQYTQVGLKAFSEVIIAKETEVTYRSENEDNNSSGGCLQ